MSKTNSSQSLRARISSEFYAELKEHFKQWNTINDSTFSEYLRLTLALGFPIMKTRNIKARFLKQSNKLNSIQYLEVDNNG